MFEFSAFQNLVTVINS